MAKPYSEDLRKRVIHYVKSGHSKADASRTYEVSYRTIERWMHRYQSTGKIKAERTGRPTGTGKITLSDLASSVERDSDKILKERGREFGVSAAALCKAMKRLRIGHKKNAALRRKG